MSLTKHEEENIQSFFDEAKVAVSKLSLSELRAIGVIARSMVLWPGLISYHATLERDRERERADG